MSLLDSLILPRLERVRKCGKGFLARCPAHNDKTASLSLREADDGRVLLNCFAGCHYGDVLAAIGLEVSDLFPDRPKGSRGNGKRYDPDQADWQAAIRVASSEAFVIRALLAELDIPANYMTRIRMASDRLLNVCSILGGRENDRDLERIAEARRRQIDSNRRRNAQGR